MASGRSGLIAAETLTVKRGDIVTVAAGSGFGGKPRPALVIQSDDLAGMPKVIVALFTTELLNRPPLRPRFEPDTKNGLAQPSELMADVIITVPHDKVGKAIGQLSATDLRRAETAILFALGFS